MAEAGIGMYCIRGDETMYEHEVNAEAEAAYQQGQAAYDSGDYDQAIADLDRAIELDPQYGSAWLTRALAYMAKHDYVCSADWNLQKVPGRSNKVAMIWISPATP